MKIESNIQQTIIYIAGAPGTGKSTLAKYLVSEFLMNFQYISPDFYKEFYWDKFGFYNKQEKDYLVNLAWQKYFADFDKLVRNNQSIITEYPFRDWQEKIFKEKYGDIKSITILIKMDWHELFKRYEYRYEDYHRHKGHNAIIFNKEKSEYILEEKRSYLEFCQIMEMKKYDDFKIGDRFIMDIRVPAESQYQSCVDWITLKLCQLKK